ncbi:unnamed protein product, partial [Prunus brigantina]
SIPHKPATITFPTPNTELEQIPYAWTKSCNKIMAFTMDCSTCFKNTTKTKEKSWVDNTTHNHSSDNKIHPRTTKVTNDLRQKTHKQ